MHALCTDVLPLLESGYSVVLVTLTDRSGSAPRTAGARMLVLADGSIRGTVGGGRYEAEAIGAALALHRDGAAADPKAARPGMVLEYTLCGVDDMDMICGGELSLLLEYLPAGDSPVRKALAFGREEELAGRAFSFVTRISEHGQDRACACDRDAGFTLPDRAIRVTAERFAIAATRREGRIPVCPPEKIPAPLLSRAALLPGSSPLPVRSLLIREEKESWLLEHFPCPSRVFFFGGGHVSLESARLAQNVGFRVIIVDDRPEFANAGRFPGAAIELPPSLSEKDTARLLSRMDISPRDALVILTRGHAHDREVLAASLRTPAGYIGMIGSKSKRNAVYEALAACGIPRERLDNVRSPIGLPIGAETPAEIAVSIAGELILWRSGLERPETV